MTSKRSTSSEAEGGRGGRGGRGRAEAAVNLGFKHGGELVRDANDARIATSAAVAGGNTDPNRAVGLPFPFKAAASKHGEQTGGSNEAMMRFD